MINVGEAVLIKEPLHQRVIGDAALDETRTRRDLIGKAAAEVIENGDVVAQVEAMAGDVRADEASAAGD